MNFDLDEDQRHLEDTLHRYFSRDFGPAKVREVFEGDGGADGALWRDLSALGLFSILVPEADGGTGGQLLDLAVAAECLGFAAAPGPFLDHVLATLAIVLAGSPSQRAALLPGLASGAHRATIAICEPDGRWEPAALAIGGERLEGTKTWVLGAGAADLVVLVLSDGLALVEGGAEGAVARPVDSIDRTRRFAALELSAPEHERLPGGLDAARRVLDAGSVLLAADAYGGAERCLREAVEYAKQREQFGVTIGHFQAVKHQLADLALAVEPARGLYWYAAHAWDHVPEDASRFASLAKAHITERYLDAARRSIEVHGGIGYTWECDLHFYLRRAIFDRAYLGLPSGHRERFARLTGWGR